MKTPATSQRERAVALIIVLAMLLLLSGLIVSFMTSVGSERAASGAHNNGLSTRQLADSTVSFVIGQIRQATTQAEAARVPTTWASQPGAIRTFAGTVGISKVIQPAAFGISQFTYKPDTSDAIYKLYSAERMRIPATDLTGKNWETNELEVIEKWDRTNSNQLTNGKKIYGYVDLNEPIITPVPASLSNNDETKVEPRYPIIDPRAKFKLDETANATANPGVVDGFDAKTQGLSDNNLTAYNVVSGKGTKVQYLPMPVKWLYVMRDGSMAAADDNKNGKIPGASLENPIVGRTSFWTDDESCKLNINTASEGTYWDTPTASSVSVSGNIDGSKVLSSGIDSFAFGASQPARGEFQRYPGHPATTSLSPAIGWMWGTQFLPPTAPPAPPIAQGNPALVNFKEAIASLAPFTPISNQTAATRKIPASGVGNTSRGGSYNPDKDMPTNLDQLPQLVYATKRLYTTVDEMVFRSDRNDGSLKNATVLNSDVVTPDKLEKVRFFLTANSRSPELNLFGRPRVTFWPVNAKLEQRTGFDDLFAFTSTLYKDPNGVRAKDNTFYFTRYDAKDASNDYTGTPVSNPPNPPNKNSRIMDYLRLMTGGSPDFSRIPGFGGSFQAKYGADEKEEILTLIFDYCRTVNLVDTSRRTRSGDPFAPYTPFYGGSTAYNADGKSVRTNDWSGQVTPGRLSNPDNIAGYQGLGRFAMISEAAIVFHRVLLGGASKLQATLLFEMATPMPGYPGIRETYWMRVTPERETFVATTAGNDLDIELVGKVGTQRINIVNVANHDATRGRAFMPTLGFLNQCNYYKEPSGPGATPDMTSTPSRKTFSWDGTDPATDSTLFANYKRGRSITFYPFVSKTFDPPAAGQQLKFKAGAYKVEIFAGEAPDDPRNGALGQRPVQTVHLSFPTAQVSATPPPAGSPDFQSRLTSKIDNDWNNALRTDDVIRTVEFVGPGRTLNQQGDLRLGMAMREIPATYYKEHDPSKYTSTTSAIHGFTCGHGDEHTGYTGGGLLTANGTNRGSGGSARKPAILPVGVNGVENAGGGVGDYDRGLSKHEDGAFGNKVDEGNVFFDVGQTNGKAVPYFRGRSIEETGRSYFSPNRQIASAVMFGSLPTGVVRGLPWQTLLFRPNRTTKTSHPGAQTTSAPADHLLLDLFNLPVVEPYAISEPFSTGGKVNLNYVIAPFGYAGGDSGTRAGNVMARSYLRRDTALRGIFKAVKIMAVKTGEPDAGHAEEPADGAHTTVYHYDIDAEKTLDQFESRLKDPERGLFRSASEICDMDLFPIGLSVSNWGTFWDTTYGQTGDNMRERPYAHIYPRVTTKSNVYTVHMRCQAVKKVPGTPPDEFDPKRDKVLAEYRGNATIERFIDPNDPQLEGYKAELGDSSVDPFYRYRVIGTKQFLPR